MKNRDFVSSLAGIALGILFCLGGWKYKLSYFGGPGAGFFPFLFGMVLILLSFIVLITSFPDFKKPAEKFFPQKDSRKKILLATGALLIYGFLLPYTGFIIITFLLILFLLRFIEPAKWPSILLASSLTTAISYIIFELWLGVQLPKGILRI